MSALYLDTSAFVKLVVEEAESAAVATLLRERGSRRVASALLRTESLRAVRHLGPEALAMVREGLRRVDLIAIDDRILDATGILEPHVLPDARRDPPRGRDGRWRRSRGDRHLRRAHGRGCQAHGASDGHARLIRSSNVRRRARRSLPSSGSAARQLPTR